ncbi:MAG: amino acid permease [Myxococcota bacterium]|nr:amino acid permease [Myxococcota bacterium]
MAKLRKELTLYGLTMVAIGSCVGSGIFLTPSQIAAHLPSPGLILLVWAVGGVIALAGALTFAELGSMYPQAGGVYAYLKEGYGELFGFLYGWAYLLVITSGANAALTIAFATYLAFVFPVLQGSITVVAILALVLVTIVNILRVKAAEMFANVFTGLKLLGIAGLIVIGLLWGDVNTMLHQAGEVVTEGGLLVPFGLALIGVLWSYGGWQHASFVAGETIDAHRTVPRAMIIGAFVVGAVYLLINLAYMFLLPVSEIAESTSVAADAIQTILPFGGTVIAILIAISVLGTAGIYTLSAPRIYHAMAEDGIFFKKLAEVHPKYRTPVNAILIQSAWAIALLIFWGTFEDVITYVVFMDWIFFGLAGACVILFRFTRPDVERPYSTFGYPITPLIFVGTSAAFAVNTLIERPLHAWVGLIFTLVGVGVFLLFKKKRMMDAA